MIKIITPGKKKYKKKCGYCGCVFTFDEDDVTRTDLIDHQMSWGIAESIKCPFCTNELAVCITDIYIGPEEEVEK